MVRQLAENTTEDVATRRAQLEARRSEIDRQLEALERGELSRLDDTGIRERFMNIEETAGRLSADFRAIEDNFRSLNAAAHRELLDYSASRGEVLENIFDARAKILDSDQGRTFNAFWEFLLDQRLRREQGDYIEQIFSLPELAAYRNEAFLPRLETTLVDAGDRVNRMTDRLVEQLRRFVQSRAFAENQRITKLIEEIEQLAVELRDTPPPHRGFTSLESKPAVNLTMDRGIFTPTVRLKLRNQNLEAGDAEAVLASALYEQLYVDPAELRGRIDALLRDRDQITLGEIATEIPPRQGLSELITYFSIATRRENEQRAIINPEREETITYESEQGQRSATFPETIFLNE